MAGKFKYLKKAITTITKGPRKGGKYTRYHYKGGASSVKSQVVTDLKRIKGDLLIAKKRLREASGPVRSPEHARMFAKRQSEVRRLTASQQTLTKQLKKL